MADLVYTYIHPVSQKHMDLALRILENDGVIAYPMDVNWAMGCDASKPKALDKLRALKPGKDQAFSLIFDSLSMAAKYTQISHSVYRHLKRMLPGPFTVLVPRNLSLLRQLKDKRKQVGFRIPDSPLVLELVRQLGRPLATTSLPRTEASFHFGYEILEAHGHALDLILDLGEALSGDPTTVIDFSDDQPEVIRLGAGSLSLLGLE